MWWFILPRGVTVLYQRVRGGAARGPRPGTVRVASAVLIVVVLGMGFVALNKKGVFSKEWWMLMNYNRRVAKYDTEVRFWGKVVDQNDQPLAGVHVKGRSVTMRLRKVEGGYTEQETMEADTKSDGTFVLEGAEGMDLRIVEIHKDGYVLPSVRQTATKWQGFWSYVYYYRSMGGGVKIFHPDPNKPVKFSLWKLEKPEPLVGPSDQSFTLKVGAAPVDTWVGMGLGPGRKPQTEEGVPKFKPDIRISASRTGTAADPEWEVKIEACDEDSGVVRASGRDAFMFTAPAEGYRPEITFRYKVDRADEIKEGMSARFFIRSKKNQWHTAVEAFFETPNGDDIYGQWRTWMNDSGSLNLEHDAVKASKHRGLRKPSDYGVEDISPPEKKWVSPGAFGVDREAFRELMEKAREGEREQRRALDEK